MMEVDRLAQDIRLADGSHELGAGALAERLIELGWTRKARLSPVTRDVLVDEATTTLAYRLMAEEACVPAGWTRETAEHVVDGIQDLLLQKLIEDTAKDAEGYTTSHDMAWTALQYLTGRLSRERNACAE